MIRPATYALLLVPLLAVLAACGGAGSKADPELLAARRSIPKFSLTTETRGEGRPPPGYYEAEQPAHYANDETFWVPIPEAQPAVLDFFRAELPKTGWAHEDPAVPSSDDQLDGFCNTPSFATCESYTKGEIRAIIVAYITFSFGTGSQEGSAYHVHVEPK